MAIKTPNGTKANSGEVAQILNMLKRLLPNTIVKGISLLLHPCCTVEATLSNPKCGWDGIDVWGASFDVTVSDLSLANQVVDVLLVSTTNEVTGESGIYVNAVLDEKGTWSGSIKTPMEGCPFPGPTYSADLTVSLIAKNLHIVHTSLPINITVPNCC